MRAAVRASTTFLLTVLAGPGALAQNFDWAGQLGGFGYDHAYDVAVDDSGNVYTVGRFEATADFDPGPGTFNLTASGGQNAFVSKLDRAGNFVWAQQLSGEANGLVVDPSGNVYTVHSAHLSKLDSTGNVVWTRQQGTRANGVTLDPSGNVCTVGYFEGTVDFDPGPGTYQLTSAGFRDAFISKLDSAGNFLWAKQLGGASHDQAEDVVVSDAGDLYTMGYFQSTADFDPGPGVFNLTSAGFDDIFISKLDSVGDFVWARRVGGTSSERLVRLGDVAVDSSGNVYTVGSFLNTVDFDPGTGVVNLAAVGLWDAFVLMLDSGGNFVWARQLAGPNQEFANAVVLDSSRNVYTVGEFTDTVDFDPGPGVFNLSSRRGSGGPTRDAFVNKLDGLGNFVWARSLSGPSTDTGYGVALDRVGNVHTVGRFYWTADFDPGPGTFDLTGPNSNPNAFVCKLRACGSFVDKSGYGRHLFVPRCTRSASTLPQDVYDSITIGVHKSASDTFYLSSEGLSFAPLIVDDAAYIGGSDCHLGPYEYQSGVPPFVLNVAIEDSFVPVPAHDITGLMGTSTLVFELLDMDRVVYGNTAVYLVRDCGIWMDRDESGQTRLNWLSHDVEVGGLQSNLDVVSGMIAEMREDGDFTSACFLVSLVDSTQVADARDIPPAGDGYYYLVSGTCENPIGYGDSSLDPDPRDLLPPGTSCP